jgi:hypothetical protein
VEALDAHAFTDAQITAHIQAKDHPVWFNMVYQELCVVGILDGYQLVERRRVIIELRLDNQVFDAN